jgi:hypothetical protein
MSSRLTAVLVVGLLQFLQPLHAADGAVVLVTSSDCEMETMTALDIRMVYLGLGVSYEGHNVRAFRLNNDEQLNQIFFQTIVAMSEKTYERRLLQLLLKYGRPRPRAVESPAELATAIMEVPCNIAYMWQADAEEYAGIKAIRVLWQEN